MLRAIAVPVSVLALFALFGCTHPDEAVVVSGERQPSAPPAAAPAGTASEPQTQAALPPAKNPPVAPRPPVRFVVKGIEWIVRAQHPNGGWGAGSHGRQDLRDPKSVQTDPATTAFTALALIRAGHTPIEGEYRHSVRLATEHLCGVVEEAPADGPRITSLSGTQIQAKLGDLVDTSMAVHFFSRVLRALPEGDALRKRVDEALEKCVKKLQSSQAADGSWGKERGWAPVLQSTLSFSALEMAQSAGKEVDAHTLYRAREYLKSNYDASTGRVNADAAAGVELYAFAGAQRAAAPEAEEALSIINEQKRSGKLSPDAAVDASNLSLGGGVSAEKAARLEKAWKQSESQILRLADEQLLSGFGNNGGEEYLSYLLTSESLAARGGEEWEKWNEKMQERLSKIQSEDGSWTGHHCITSPVFCTAAVVQCLTADREADLLREMGTRNVASTK